LDRRFPSSGPNFKAIRWLPHPIKRMRLPKVSALLLVSSAMLEIHPGKIFSTALDGFGSETRLIKLHGERNGRAR
jgi:hypothetical protein